LTVLLSSEGHCLQELLVASDGGVSGRWVLGKATGPLPSKFWATSAPSSEDEDSDEEVDEEIMAEVPGTPKLVATATTLGFSAQDLLTAEKELQATNKVYSNSNSLKKASSLAHQIVSSLVKHKLKAAPWIGPLHLSRVSPPQTLGDAIDA
jgi:hypothetical protein